VYWDFGWNGFRLIRARRPVDIFGENISYGGLKGYDHGAFPEKIFRVSRVPPSHTSLKSPDWRGFCKNGRQNIERLGFRGQNIDNKRFMALP
jgi:hypothetical protein